MGKAEQVIVDAHEQSGWQARLELHFAPSNTKTLLARRDQFGPLTVQRPFYPEGGVCHVYLLHPPGGIVAGDQLNIQVSAASGSHALITTPAAGKFYRSDDARRARQAVNINIAEAAALEWLPQETIIYEGAQLDTQVSVNLAANARFIGWEILSLGRPASHEGFRQGSADLYWQIYQQGRPLLLERLRLDAEAFSARWGLQGHSACGTLFATPTHADSLAAIQQLIGDSPNRGVTRLDDLIVCRALDKRSDLLRQFFEQVWQLLRPDTLNSVACAPRIWAT